MIFRQTTFSSSTNGTGSADPRPALALSGPDFRPLSSLKDLAPEPPWLWDGFLAEGAVTMLAGHPFAGKSMLVGGLLRALEQGTPFLGRPTVPATTLLLTEEDDTGLRARAEALGSLDVSGEYIGRTSGVLAWEWDELL